MKFILFLIGVLFTTSIYAQEAGKLEWTRISSPKGDVVLSMPVGFLVDGEGTELRIVSIRGGVTLDFTVTRGVDPKRRLGWLRESLRQSGKFEHSQLTLGKFIGDVLIYSEKRYSIQFYLASGKGYYQIRAAAETASNPVLLEFLNSIRLDGQPLTKQDTPAVFTQDAVPIQKLETSPIVKEALKKPDARKVKVIYDSNAKPSELPSQDGNSRPVMVLRKPQALYSSAARNAGVQGAVRLKVQLRGDGGIGDIIIVSGLAKGLTEKAVDAAKKIKFVPAEKDGKPIDSLVTFEYTFSLY